MPSPAELERLLREDHWLRRLARRLAGDPESAEDLAQEAWVVALDRGRGDRPWLFGVLRNLRRVRGREAARGRALRPLPVEEEAPASDERVDEIVDELLLRKRVTDALLELDEPWRTALTLRFVHDQRLSVIARRTGVAVSTVHERIAQGLERLRGRLDAQYGGRRRAWAFGLLSLAKPAGFAATLGGLVVGTSAKIAGAALLVGGAFLLWWQGSGSAPRAASLPGPESTAPTQPSPAESRVAEAPPPTEPERVPAPTVASAPLAPAPEPVRLPGLLLDLDGRPVAAARVGYETPAGGHDGPDAVTDGRGEFTLVQRDPAEESPSLVCREPDLVTLVHGLPRDGLRVVVVGRRASYAGSVRDAAGHPIAGATLRFDVRQSLFRERGIVRPWTSSKPRPFATSDELGRFALADVCGGEHVGLWVVAQGYHSLAFDLPEREDLDLRIVLEAEAGERWLEGIVLDPHGAGVEGARVSAGTEIVTSDADGRFRLSWSLESAGDYEQDEEGTWRPERDTSILRAVHAGFLPAEARIADLPPGELVVLSLGGPPLSIRGRVVDEAGAPRPGVLVWPGKLTALGQRSQSEGGARAVWNEWIEDSLRADPRRPGALTDADGRFELDGLLPRVYDLRAHDPATATEGGPWSAMPGEAELEFVLATEPGTRRVAGRIVTLAGTPLAGVSILPQRQRTFNDGSQPPRMPDVELGLETDADGRFAFPALATRGTLLELQHEALFFAHVRLEGRDDLDDMEIVQPVLCELQIELADPDLADRIVVLDEKGAELQLIVSFGAFTSMAEWAEIEAGKTAVLRVQETARTLVLRRSDQEVLRRPVQLTPGSRTELRL